VRRPVAFAHSRNAPEHAERLDRARRLDRAHVLRIPAELIADRSHGLFPARVGAADEHRRPPLATRFRPGQSGNPRGSRKRAGTFGAAVAAALGEKIDVKENGRSRRIHQTRGAAKQLANRAASGDQRAMQLVVRLRELVRRLSRPPA